MEDGTINGRPRYIEMNKEDGDPFQRTAPVRGKRRPNISFSSKSHEAFRPKLCTAKTSRLGFSAIITFAR